MLPPLMQYTRTYLRLGRIVRLLAIVDGSSGNNFDQQSQADAQRYST
jgi:hypothetical protein